MTAGGPAPAADEAPPRLALARLPTPLLPLERLSREAGGPRLWVKRDDLTGAALSGNKVRKLEYVVAEALARGADTLITCGGVQSNHCRATALVGAGLGLKVHLVLRGAPEAAPEGNLFLDYLAGAEVSFVEEARYRAELESILEDLRRDYEARGRRAHVVPSGASDEVGVWGYVGAAGELKADAAAAGIALTTVVCAVGSGGTQAGLLAGLRAHGLSGARVLGIAVGKPASEMVEKIETDLAAWGRRYRPDLDLSGLAVEVLGDYIGEGYAIAGPEVLETIRHAARLEGLILDPVYTGKAFHALLDLIAKGRFGGETDVVFLHSGGIFGLLAQRAELGISGPA